MIRIATSWLLLGLGLVGLAVSAGAQDPAEPALPVGMELAALQACSRDAAALKVGRVVACRRSQDGKVFELWVGEEVAPRKSWPVDQPVPEPPPVRP